MTLGTQEQRRLMVLNQVGSGALSGGEAAVLVGLSERHLRRLRRKYEVEGAGALVHGNQGRQPANAIPGTIRERVVALARGRYVGFNQQHLTEMMAEHDKLRLSRSTVAEFCWRQASRAHAVAGGHVHFGAGIGSRGKGCCCRLMPVATTGSRAAVPGSAWWAGSTTRRVRCPGPCFASRKTPRGISS